MIEELIEREDHLLVIVTGSIYLEDANTLRAKLFGCIEMGHTSLVIDLSGVDYIDGSGLGTMVAVQRKAYQRGGRLCVKGLNGFVKELFDLTHLSNVIETQ
jgi:anti-sigma B factor antagonist